jgi:hypothetical protein
LWPALSSGAVSTPFWKRPTPKPFASRVTKCATTCTPNTRRPSTTQTVPACAPPARIAMCHGRGFTRCSARFRPPTTNCRTKSWARSTLAKNLLPIARRWRKACGRLCEPRIRANVATVMNWCTWISASRTRTPRRSMPRCLKVKPRRPASTATRASPIRCRRTTYSPVARAARTVTGFAPGLPSKTAGVRDRETVLRRSVDQGRAGCLLHALSNSICCCRIAG